MPTLAGHSFQFPLLPLEGACQVTAALRLPAIDIGALKGYAHIDPDEIEADPRAIADSPDVSVIYSNPDSGVSAPFGNFSGCFLTRATLLNPLGSVRTTGRVPSTIELVVQPTSKQ